MQPINKTNLFLLLTFGISFAAAGLFYLLGGQLSSTGGLILATFYMFTPMISVLIVEKLIYKEDIVLLNFPFTEVKSYKKRPALIINDDDDVDIIVCRITSQIYDTKNDYYLDSWRDAGLKLPSVVRVHKIATLDKSLFETKMGKLDELSKKSNTQIIKNLTA